MYTPTTEELYCYSSKTFSIICAPVEAGKYMTRYSLTVYDEVTKEVIEVETNLVDSQQVRYAFNRLKDKYILDYEQKLTSSKLIIA